MNSDLPPSSPIDGLPQGQMVPIRLPSYPAYVTYTLLGITVIIYLLQMGTQMIFNVDFPQMIGVKYNPYIIEGQIWRLFTPMFLHGSLLHIAFNMYALYRLGPGLERFYGHGRFLALYFVAGFAGNVASFTMTTAASLGSSTAIFGLLGAEGVFLYQNRSVFGGRTRQALQQIIMLAAINLMIGLSPGIDNWGHLGGLVGGVSFAWLAGPVLHVEGIYPNLALMDDRSSREAWLAVLGVGGMFAFLALAIIIIRSP